jgi:hypothetical protein
MRLKLLLNRTLVIIMFGVMLCGLADRSLVYALHQSCSKGSTLGTVESVNTSSATVTFAAAILSAVLSAVFIGYLR